MIVDVDVFVVDRGYFPHLYFQICVEASHKIFLKNRGLNENICI